MNTVVSAIESAGGSSQTSNKNFEIILPRENCVLMCGGEKQLSRGQIAVVPPLTARAVRGAATFIMIEQALLPFKEIVIINDDDGSVARAAERAVKYFGRGDKGLNEALGGLITAYITAFSGKVKFSPVVETIRTEIRAKVSDSSFSLEDCIKKLPLNYDYVRKLFKRETGITPHEFQTECRMKLARCIIESGIGNKYSNYSVAQIAEACGFSDPLYFSRVFKKFYGVSPSQLASDKQ